MARPGSAKKKLLANYRNKPTSLYVRGLISAEEYFKLTGQGKK